MNRVITQIGQSIYEWFFTKPAQDNMVALGKLTAAVLGTSPLANGLACTPTSPASLQVNMGPGEVYALAPLEATAYGTLPADTTHQIVKQGVSLDPVLVSCPPPPTAGQAINYLIQVQYQDQDVSLDPTSGNPAPVVLQFFNSSNPTQPWQGPNNSGQTSNTFRKGVVGIQAKAGIAAPTGTQVAPAPDTGWTGLWVVTVANGQASITAGNIAPYAGAPFLTETLQQKISQTTADARYLQPSQVSGVVGTSRNAKMYVPSASASATFTADEIILESALGGLRYCLSNVSDTFNLTTDMDTGSAPASGFVALYKLYNPSTGASLRRIVNATAAVLPEIYSGAAVPQGFTASALVGVVPTNAAGQFAPFNISGRTVSIPRRQSISTAVVSAGYSSVTIADIPKNAKWIGGFLGVSNSTANASFGFWVGSDANGSGETWCSGILPQPGVGSTTAFGCAVVSPQTLFYTSTSSGGTVSQNIFTTSYQF